MSTPSAVPSTTSPRPSQPPPPAPPAVDPLTGSGAAPTAPLVVMKVDDAPLARPFQRGLEAAPLVYVELVEGGLARFIALYDSAPDVQVGPVRSLRESDIELLRQFGKPAVAFSGANTGVLTTFRQAVAAGQAVEVSYENHRELFGEGPRRVDARNFFASPAALAGAAAGAAPVHAAFTFGSALPATAVPAGGAHVVFSPQQSFDLRYDAASHHYAVLQGGAAVPGAAPVNVVVQQVQVKDSRYHDVHGSVTPYTTSVGSGPVQVLSGGKVAAGTWSRPDVASATQLLDAAGQPLPLAPGPTWILLQPAGQGFSAG